MTVTPGKWPARIVQTISGPGTTLDGDTLVDENGHHWRRLSEGEAAYYRSGTPTISARLGTIRDGKIY